MWRRRPPDLGCPPETTFPFELRAGCEVADGWPCPLLQATDDASRAAPPSTVDCSIRRRSMRRLMARRHRVPRSIRLIAFTFPIPQPMTRLQSRGEASLARLRYDLLARLPLPP